MKSKCGDNINSVHHMKELENAPDILISYCTKCKERFFLRKGDGRIDPKYNKLFKRDTLQPNTNLYYKEYGKMNLI